jgi:hypothetical protein
MVDASRSDFSSAFDDMLSKNKQSLAELYRGSESIVGSGVPAGSAIGRENAGVPPPRSGRAAALASDSAAVRLLNERLGSGWRFEIVDEKRDGDEAIILCRLILGKDGAVRAQFGRAKIASGAVTGASGGVRFKVGGTSTQDEREAFGRATEAALMNCADLI